MLAFAERNGVEPPYSSVDAAREAYHFADLQSFLDLYYRGTSVLQTEQDFADLCDAYFRRACDQGVVHAEIFFDPQAHIERGLAFETFFDGLWSAVSRSEERHGITSALIMCFLRDRGAAAAQTTLTSALPHAEKILGVGLDSSERGYPPALFEEVFERARIAGWRCVAHAGEEGPPAYIAEALDVLRVERIDHGIRCLEDPSLVERLREDRIPLTVCPLSNLKLRVVPSLREHPLGKMLEAGLLATCNSDDPAYFGGYAADNLREVSAALGLPGQTAVTLARNSFEAAFLPQAQKAAALARLEASVPVMSLE